MRPTASTMLKSIANKHAFLISNLANIHFVTGVEMSTGLLLAQQSGFTLFVDGRYIEVARSGVPSDVRVRDAKDFLLFMGKIRRCAIEAEHVTLSRFARWKRTFKNTKFVQVEGIVEAFRRAKGPKELQSFRRAQAITRTMIGRVPSALKPGITERELAWKLRSWAMELGAEDLSFDPIVAFGPNTSRPHHQPSHRKLRARDIIQIDTGARKGGYCADQSAVFFLGNVPREQQLALEAVSKAKEEAMHAVKTGVSTHALDRIARTILAQYGMDKAFVHSLGHGVGLEVHEGPTLSQKTKDIKLLSNEIVTIEPGVYFPGKFGIRLEDEIIVQ